MIWLIWQQICRSDQIFDHLKIWLQWPARSYLPTLDLIDDFCQWQTLSYWCYLWNENSSFMEFVYSIDELEVDARGFISNGKKGKESEIAKRQRERECVWEVVCCSKRKIASAIKLSVRERTTCDTNVRLIREVDNVVNDVFPTICICWTVCLKMTFRSPDMSQIS